MQALIQAQQQTKHKLLHKITLIYALMDEFPEEVSLHTANVYSYMLCKYNWFNLHKQDYFETQETIAEGSRVSMSAVKTAVRFLIKHNIIVIKKAPTAKFNRNLYTVVDRYGIYAKNSSVGTVSKHEAIPSAESGLPW